MTGKQSLAFVLRNNTAGTIPVSLLNPSLPNNNIANQFTRYAWDITSETYTPLTFSILAKFSSSGSFEAFSGLLAAANANALVAALNNLNIGVFWLETSGSMTFLVTWNDKVTYSDLTVGAASPPSVNLNWANYTTLPGGSLLIDVNAVNQVTNFNPGYSFNNLLVENGDNIDVTVEASPGEPTDFTVSRILIAPPYTPTILYFNTVPGGANDAYSFSIDILYNYEVAWGTPP